MNKRESLADFERTVLPHLDAAYNLARWLLRDSEDAQDVTQEAILRAFKYFDGFRGDNPKAWLLQIARNSCYSWIKNRRQTESMSPDADGHLNPEHERALQAAGHGFPAPDARLIEMADRRLMQEGIQALPSIFRETLILREIEELSYQEIGEITGVPIGTVMSRLSRARALLLQYVSGRLAESGRAVQCEMREFRSAVRGLHERLINPVPAAESRGHQTWRRKS